MQRPSKEGNYLLDAHTRKGDNAPSGGAESRLPRTQVFKYYEPEESEWKMEFRLVYKGRLPAEKCEDRSITGTPIGRAKDKHWLRKQFHPQLRELWNRHPDLLEQSRRRFKVITTPSHQISYPGPNVEQIIVAYPNDKNAKTWLEHLADNHVRCNGNRFVPLVREEGGFTCALEILFLRRDEPGGVITSGGDIDNRIKVLFDGLTMPAEVKQLGGYPIEADEDPFFCLLENDKLVTGVSVTTDRLLVPLESEEHINDVELIIHVTVVNPSAIFAGGRLV